MKYMKDFVDLFSKRDLFSLRDVKMFLAQRGAPKSYQRIFLNNLVKRGEIAQISRGKYSFFKQIDFVEKAVFPSYRGLQDALSLHRIWSQQTIPIIITPLKIRSGIREISGGRVLVRRVNRRMFFGYESIAQGDFWISVSDAEKTLIDFAYYNEPLDGETLKKVKKLIDKKKLSSYLKKATPLLRKKVLARFGIKA